MEVPRSRAWTAILVPFPTAPNHTIKETHGAPVAKGPSGKRQFGRAAVLITRRAEAGPGAARPTGSAVAPAPSAGPRRSRGVQSGPADTARSAPRTARRPRRRPRARGPRTPAASPSAGAPVPGPPAFRATAGKDGPRRGAERPRLPV